ncbi:ABC transporter substrate-binding protein [Kocuria tytonis]|uniref:Amino acid ABC transporter substrate-binding protein n=1 Tax=Kocuria tytonis TaxID=2054280 RepID=A0A495AAA1_9MICC|nr:ABC transporter substrate-binding protein [Kocuria tytonis]RKQ36997.1 amino acid ABC transporter substrate-binding protein [Kocuria tytonis]
MPAPRRFASALAAVCTAGVALAGCGSTSDDDARASQGPGTFTVCTNSPYAPFEFERDGETVGFDMSLGQEIARDMGRTMRVVRADFHTLESGAALDEGRCDAAISGITITPARRRAVDFSEPYFNDQIALLTTKDSGITGFAAVGTRTVGVQRATSGAQYASDRKLTVREYEDADLMFRALGSGKVKAVSGNISTLSRQAREHPDFRLVQTVDTNENLGVAVKKGNTEILDAVNRTLERITRDGTADSLKAEWMGV